MAPANLERLLRSVGGDRATLGRLVSTFLEDYPARLEQIRGALARADAPALARGAHALRGALILLEARECLGIASRLEEHAKATGLEGAGAVVGELELAAERLAEYLREEAVSV